MRGEIYYSEPTLDFKDSMDDRIDNWSEGKTSVSMARASICSFDEESASTENTFVRRLRKSAFSYALVSCIFRKEISPMIPKIPTLVKGNSKEIFFWYSALPKDEEFANLLDDVVDRMRELKIH